MDAVQPIRRERADLVFGNGYGRLYNDKVVAASGQGGEYLRWQWSRPGVVCVPVHEGLVALAQMFRYPIGRTSLELPRGGREIGEDAGMAAERELLEEFGLRTSRSRCVGSLFPDTGLIETSVEVVVCEVADPEPEHTSLEVFEAAGRFAWLGRSELLSLVGGGSLNCALTISALALVAIQGELAGG